MTGDREHRVVASVTVNGHAPARGPGGAGAAECVIPSPPAGATAAWLCAEVERRCLFAVPAEVVATERIRCAAEGGEEVADAEVVSGRGRLAVSFRRTPRAGRLPREMVMRMYARENELRLSPEVQAEYSEQLIPFNGPTTRNLQRQLLREFGLPSCDDGLRVWWTQRGIYQRAGDAEVLAIPLYVKHDHSRQGDLSVGDDYVDCRVVGLDGAERKLSDFVTAAEGRPLVVIGASYSWPPFRVYAEFWNQIYQRWRSVAPFVHVYLREAHASDEWPVGSRVQFRQHRTQAERIERAQQCRGDLRVEFPGVTDHIDNDFNNTYAAWPERFYIISGGKMAFIAQPKDAVFDPYELVEWLEQYAAERGIAVDAP